MLFSILSENICAIACQWEAEIILLLAPFQHFSQAIQFAGVNTLILENVEHEQFVGIAEEAVYQVTDLGAGCLLAFDQRRVYVGAAIFHVLYVALLFKNTDGGEHRVVGQRRFLGKMIDHVLDGGWALFPQDFHEPQFSFG
jgi:hypothetical protein